LLVTREPKGGISVREAGHKGGQRVIELVEKGKHAAGSGSEEEERNPKH
jgi:hypothetical protein